jgi:membrane fusion protein (multidrug efflux system)
MTTLSDNSQMFAYFNVSEPEYLDYQKNIASRGDNHVQLLLANNEPLEQKGIVETIEGEFDLETGILHSAQDFQTP